MIIDNNFALNPYTSDIEKMELVNKGDEIYANANYEDFYLTHNKGYILLDYQFNEVKIQNDLDMIEWYSVDYFSKYKK